MGFLLFTFRGRFYILIFFFGFDVLCRILASTHVRTGRMKQFYSSQKSLQLTKVDCLTTSVFTRTGTYLFSSSTFCLVWIYIHRLSSFSSITRTFFVALHCSIQLRGRVERTADMFLLFSSRWSRGYHEYFCSMTTPTMYWTIVHRFPFFLSCFT